MVLGREAAIIRSSEASQEWKSHIDYGQLTQEILSILRGHLPQRKLSERLDYSFNQVGKWESGFTRFKWSHFLKMANVLGLPIEKSFKNFFWNFEGEFNLNNTLTSLEKFVLSSTLENAEERRTIKKWVKLQIDPDFEQILKILNSKPSVLVGWLSTFLDCTKIPCLKEKYRVYLLCLEFIQDYPLCGYINAALKLKVYKDLEKHDEKLLAEHSACSILQLRETLGQMMSYNLIRYDGQKYHPCPFDFTFSCLANPKLRNLTKYTTELAALRYPSFPISIDPITTPNSSFSSVRVVAMSASTSKKVRDLIAQFHNDVSELLSEDQSSKDNVQIILIHSFASNINSSMNC